MEASWGLLGRLGALGLLGGSWGHLGASWDVLATDKNYNFVIICNIFKFQILFATRPPPAHVLGQQSEPGKQGTESAITLANARIFKSVIEASKVR